MDVDLLLTAVTVAALVWMAGEGLYSWFDGSVPVAFRRGRELVGLVAGGLGVSLYVVLTDTRPEVLPAVAALSFGVVAGYLDTWRGGSVEDFGVAVIWTSPWYVAAWSVGGITALSGSIWLEDLTVVGVVVMIGAVGMGIGRYVFGLQSARRARRLAEAEMLDVRALCPICGFDIRAGDRFCMNCGGEQPRYCSECAEQLTEAALFCAHCGAEDAGPQADPDEDAVTQRFCYVCSTALRLSAGACDECGSVQPEPCSLCGAPTLAGDDYCGLCGIDLELAELARADGVFDEVEVGVGPA
jgi:hypothetical protein